MVHPQYSVFIDIVCQFCGQFMYRTGNNFPRYVLGATAQGDSTMKVSGGGGGSNTKSLIQSSEADKTAT